MSRVTRAFFALLLVAAQLGCRSGIERLCDQIAPEWSGVTVGAFPTTLGRIRSLYPLRMASDRWPGVSDDIAAIVCYVDGSIPKAPPGGEPFDRAIVAVVNGKADLVVAGYRSSLPVRAP